jgi:hypothetical protein
VRGPTRPRGSSMSASAAIADAFKAALDEVEHNYSTQVCGLQLLAGSTLVCDVHAMCCWALFIERGFTGTGCISS